MVSDVADEAVSYLSALRKARDRRAVLKLNFVSLRGRCPGVPILAFEGDDDKIVYGRWIGRLRPSMRYEAFVCKGKNGLRSLQAMLLEDLGRLANDTYLFVDRDFDDLDGFAANDSIFVTERYSVENYLVAVQVVDSLLRDELSCHQNPDLRAEITNLFDTIYKRFLEETSELNWRLFLARRGKLTLTCSLPDKLSGLAQVLLDNVIPAELPAAQAVTFDGVLNEEDEQALRVEFDALERTHRYRGKNAYMFFTHWLNLLCEELAQRENSRFGGPPSGGRLRREELSLGGYASKSVMPLGLPEFVSRIAA